MPLNGLSREKPASCCGFSQLRLPPRMRPPRRSLTGTRSSSLPARCGPAKRTSTPPSSIHLFEPARALRRRCRHRRGSASAGAGRGSALTASAGATPSASAHVGERIERAREIISWRRAAAASGRRSSPRRRRRCGGASACRAVARRRPSARRRSRAAPRRCGSRPADRSPRRSRVSLGLERERRFAERQALEVDARCTRPFSAAPVCARSTFTVSAPAALSAAASACADGEAAVDDGERMIADDLLAGRR